MKVGVDVLRGGEGVGDVGLGAIAGAERANLRAGVVLVVEALVGGFGVEIDGAGRGRAGSRALIGDIERAAGQIADDRGVAADGEVAAESEGKGADGGKCGRGGIVGEYDVGDLLGGDVRAGNFDFVFAGSGVEEIVAHAVGGGGVGESLGEAGVRVDKRERRAGLAAGGHGADAHGGSGERDAAGVEDDVVLARALGVRGSDRSRHDMQQERQQSREKRHCDGAHRAGLKAGKARRDFESYHAS